MLYVHNYILCSKNNKDVATYVHMSLCDSLQVKSWPIDSNKLYIALSNYCYIAE